MMFQPVEQPEFESELNDRPNHPTVIQSDEIVDLKIDLQTLDTDEIYEKYFAE